MIGAFFDVEGTLYSAQMARGLLEYARNHRRRLSVAVYYSILAPRYAMYKLGLTSDESARRAAIQRLSWVIRGWTLEEGQAAFDWIIREVLLPSAHVDVMDRLEQHRRNGDAIVLVSGMPSPCLELLGKTIGATAVVGTRLQIENGRFTGNIIPPVMVGKAKDEYTRSLLAQRGMTIDWAGSYAYADSVHDRALLEMVGHAVAVYPDLALRELAYQRGWDAIGAPSG